jgi:hypothetical protein
MPSGPSPTFRRYDLHVPGSSFNHRNCEACNTFAATNCAEAFSAIPLHRDRSTNGA